MATGSGSAGLPYDVDWIKALQDQVVESIEVFIEKDTKNRLEGKEEKNAVLHHNSQVQDKQGSERAEQKAQVKSIMNPMNTGFTRGGREGGVGPIHGGTFRPGQCKPYDKPMGAVQKPSLSGPIGAKDFTTYPEPLIGGQQWQSQRGRGHFVAGFGGHGGHRCAYGGDGAFYRVGGSYSGVSSRGGGTHDRKNQQGTPRSRGRESTGNSISWNKNYSSFKSAANQQKSGGQGRWSRSRSSNYGGSNQEFQELGGKQDLNQQGIKMKAMDDEIQLLKKSHEELKIQQLGGKQDLNQQVIKMKAVDDDIQLLKKSHEELKTQLEGLMTPTATEK